MNLAEDPHFFLRQQVAERMYQGQNDEQVLRWLKNQAGLEGKLAQALVAEGHLAKRREVRRRAKWLLLGGVLGLCVPLVYYGAQFFTGYVVIGKSQIAVAVLAAGSVAAIIRSVYQLVTGHVEGSVE